MICEQNRIDWAYMRSKRPYVVPYESPSAPAGPHCTSDGGDRWRKSSVLFMSTAGGHPARIWYAIEVREIMCFADGKAL
jgi:hypothetical protein